jgi:membrane protease YdiL (CAAX protease family)
MVIASIFTTLPFALVHADQQGHSLGPFILLIVVSLILCAVRLVTRSLAASTLVHACYNFLLFFFMLIGTEGFRHLEKL